MTGRKTAKAGIYIIVGGIAQFFILIFGIKLLGFDRGNAISPHTQWLLLVGPNALMWLLMALGVTVLSIGLVTMALSTRR